MPPPPSSDVCLFVDYVPVCPASLSKDVCVCACLSLSPRPETEFQPGLLGLGLRMRGPPLTLRLLMSCIQMHEWEGRLSRSAWWKSRRPFLLADLRLDLGLELLWACVPQKARLKNDMPLSLPPCSPSRFSPQWPRRWWPCERSSSSALGLASRSPILPATPRSPLLPSPLCTSTR